MLRHLIEKQQEMFLQQGGIREQMSFARSKNKYHNEKFD
ncbi:four helix bundle suffix domain-containing protein [Capnocytophaga genosp. AHN8471]|nr:four helix bundle suffix domain-containing protein [Capnocytophaga genosp. AHN8471]